MLRSGCPTLKLHKYPSPKCCFRLLAGHRSVIRYVFLHGVPLQYHSGLWGGTSVWTLNGCWMCRRLHWTQSIPPMSLWFFCSLGDSSTVNVSLETMLDDGKSYAERPRERNSGEIFAHMSETSGENFADFRPSISKIIGRKKFHKKSAANSMSHDISFFTVRLWELGGTTRSSKTIPVSVVAPEHLVSKQNSV